MVMHDANQAVKILVGLRDMGMTIAIDDFGTGYSSLGYLKKFPINTLKVDQSFIRDLTKDSDDDAIVLAIIYLAHGLGLDVVAEGVETSEQQEFLSKHNCGSIQGYLFSHPLPPEQFAKFVQEHAQQVQKQ